MNRLIRALALFALLALLWALAGTLVDEQEVEEARSASTSRPTSRGLQCRADDFELQLRAVEDAIAAREIARAIFPEVDP